MELTQSEIEDELPGIDGGCEIRLVTGEHYGAWWNTDPHVEDYPRGVSVERYLPYGVVVEFWRCDNVANESIETLERIFIPYTQIAYISSESPVIAEARRIYDHG